VRGDGTLAESVLLLLQAGSSGGQHTRSPRGWDAGSHPPRASPGLTASKDSAGRWRAARQLQQTLAFWKAVSQSYPKDKREQT